MADSDTSRVSDKRLSWIWNWGTKSDGKFICGQVDCKERPPIDVSKTLWEIKSHLKTRHDVTEHTPKPTVLTDSQIAIELEDWPMTPIQPCIKNAIATSTPTPRSNAKHIPSTSTTIAKSSTARRHQLSSIAKRSPISKADGMVIIGEVVDEMVEKEREDMAEELRQAREAVKKLSAILDSVKETVESDGAQFTAKCKAHASLAKEATTSVKHFAEKVIQLADDTEQIESANSAIAAKFSRAIDEYAQFLQNRRQ